MAEVKSGEQPSFLSKRNPDSDCADLTDANQFKKKKKIEGLADGKELAVDQQQNALNVGEANPEDSISDKEDKIIQKGGGEEETMLDGEQGNDGDDKETGREGEEKDDEHLNGKAEIDRKGKGIMIEEEEDGSDDDDDGSDDDDDSDDDSCDGMDDASEQDSDSVDDPLAEVNIDNILPSRTRGRVLHPDAYTASDLAAGDDDDDSDDSDA